jgi:NTE family protein
MSGNTKALVLSGGGTAGGAWMLGIIDALRNHGVDLGDAELIVGTSAGARTGAQLATGVLDQGVAMYQRSEVPRLEVSLAFEEFVAAVTRIVAETPDRQEAARRIANLQPLGSRLGAEGDRRRMVATDPAGGVHGRLAWSSSGEHKTGGPGSFRRGGCHRSCDRS